MPNFAFNPDKQRILDAVDLADLIGEQLPLRRAGREFKAVCPFHDDTNPSLFVNPQKGIYKCFACGAGGNALTWLENYFNLTRGEAWKMLSERTGIELQFNAETTRRQPRPTSDPAKNAHQPTDSEFPEYVDVDPAEIVQAHQTALSFYRTILKHPVHGAEARRIYQARDISEAMIQRFELGAAPGGDQWDGLVQTLQARQLDLQPFLASGLISKRRSSSGYYDRFRNRLIFPIQDLLGRPIAFGARIIAADDEPKYLNSPEHPRFNKSATLYGLNLAQRTIQAEGRAIVVEGYTDVIACHQAGVTNAVATLGTALTREQAQILQRFCPRVVLLFDGDRAGRKAADRAVEIFFQTSIDIQIALLPDGLDPADLLNQTEGRNQFETVIAGAAEALDFLLAAFQKEIANDTGISGRQKLIEEFLARLGALGYHRMSPMRRDLVIPRLAEMLGIPHATIHQAIPKPRRYVNDSQRLNRSSGRNGHGEGHGEGWGEASPYSRSKRAAERGILGCILNHPALLETETTGSGENQGPIRNRLDQLEWSQEPHRELYHRILELLDDCAERAVALPTTLPDFEDPDLTALATDLYWELNRQTKEGNLELITYLLAQFCETIAEFAAEHRFNLMSASEKSDPGAEKVGSADSPTVRLEQFREKIQQLRELRAHGGHRRSLLRASGRTTPLPTEQMEEPAEVITEIILEENVTPTLETEKITPVPVGGTPENPQNSSLSGDS